jgi:hypothetical protein
MTISTAQSAFAANRDALPQVKEKGSLMGNKVRRAYAKYTLLGTEAEGCVVEMLTLPAGAVILPLSNLYTQDLGTDVNLEVGDGDDSDEFMTAAAGTTAASLPFTRSLMPYELTAETTFYVTLVDAGSFAVSAGQYFELEVYYVTPN